MNKKGFTLIEIMGVVVLISLVFLLVFPTILNKIKNAQESIDKNIEKIIISSAKDYINDNKDDFLSYDEHCIEISRLIDNKYLDEEIITNNNDKFLNYYVKLTRDNKYEFSNKCILNNYEIGDKIKYQDIDFYVIKDNKKYLTLLKAEPLSVEEVNDYGDEYINRFTNESVGVAKNSNGYGAIAYYSSETCGYINGKYIATGCKSEYELSDVKYLIDNWAKEKIKSEHLIKDDLGYKVRLITKKELNEDLGCKEDDCDNSKYVDWLIDNYNYYTMTPYAFYANWGVHSYKKINHNHNVFVTIFVVRPVINLRKSALNKG